MNFVLLASVFVVATCGLTYELIAGTLASYLLGDSVTQFSTVIGVYLSSMGAGSYLSRYVKKHQLRLFVYTELLVAFFGGSAAALLFIAFELAGWFHLILYFEVFIIGTLVGLEIPLLMHILREEMSFIDLISRVLCLDYIGALVASILFPVFLLPWLGLVRTGFLFGILNALVALWVLVALEHKLAGHRRGLKIMCTFVLIVLTAGFALSERLQSFAENAFYDEPIIYAKNTHYQRLVLTRNHDALRLYLNRNLQFDSRDEYRYHEALVHPGLAGLTDRQRVLVLGGGDGLAVREILRYQDVESVTLVDLDPEMTKLFSQAEFLRALNQNSLLSPKVTKHNADAFIWLRETDQQFDFIVIDFPDPTNFSLGKLYSTRFFAEIQRVLAPQGRVVVQSTSPLYARQSFWCVDATIRSVGLQTVPYHVYIPSFGEWGYILASREQIKFNAKLPNDLRFIDRQTMITATRFPADMNRVKTEINRLDNQALVRYYESEWGRYI
jgi:spermidine synthase